MRVKGMTKIAIVLLADVILLQYVLGLKLAVIVTFCILLYGWLGEYIILLKDGAIGVEKLNEYEKQKIENAHICLTNDVKRVSGMDISRLKIHLIPSDNINAYAYGYNNIAITRAALNNCDDLTLCSVLGHEVSHILNLDAIFSRVIFANVTCIMVGITISSLITVSAMWIIFLVLCLIGVCGGFFSMFLFHGMKKFIQGFFSLLQRILVFVYQTIMGFISRSCEFRSDKYSCELGYGSQLSYFLSRFIEDRSIGQRTIEDILYDSHPATYKRIQRIEQYVTTSNELRVK